MAGSRDAVGAPALFATQKQYIEDLTVIEIDATHWIMEEKFQEVNNNI